MNLKSLIKEQLLLEKRIAQIVTTMEVSFNFEFHKGGHGDSREIRTDQGENYNQRQITNQELKYFIDNFVKYQIAKNIIDGEIQNKIPFIVKSLKWELAFPIYPNHEGGTHWRMVIGTLWRESKLNRFRIGEDQFVINVE